MKTYNIKMDWEFDVFQLTYQPDPTKTILNSGVFNQNIRLNEEQAAGLLLMAENLFGARYYDHLRLQLVQRKKLSPYVASQYRPRHLITQSRQILIYDPYQETWYQYISRVAGSNGQLPNDITMPYTCRFLTFNHQITIEQFRTSDFVDSARLTCNIFGFNWMDFIDEIHRGNEPVTL